MGVTLPDDVRQCYRIHNGCHYPFLYGWVWNSLSRVVSDWRILKKLLDDGSFDPNRGSSKGPIQAVWYHVAWIPITDSEFGYHHCLDLAPKAKGHVGQVITWCHDEPNRYHEAKSFTEWLDRFATELELGEWVTSEDDGPGLHSVDDL